MATLFRLCLCLLSITFSQLISTLAQHDTYIVHMDLSSMPKAFLSHHSWFLATLTSISDNSKVMSLASSKLIYSYTNVLHGFSATLSPSELKALKNYPGYVSSYRDSRVKIDTTHSSQFLGLNFDSGLWPVSNYGNDIIIGLVDTGVWPESESFNDNGMTEIPSRWKGQCESGTQFNSSTCNKKLIGARFFNKGLLAQNPNVTLGMNSSRDTNGHGTHTSTTAAGGHVEGASYFGYASGTSGGVAPKARVAMYKAVWDQGSYASDIIAAIDQAIFDGVDVLSLSLSLDYYPLYEDPVAIASFAALEKGIFVSSSAGNLGPPFGLVSNGIPWVLTVAAGTVDRDFNGIIFLGNGVSVTGSSLYRGNSTSTQVPIVFMDSCHSSALMTVGQKIVVCQDKNWSITDQMINVEEAKVAGGIFITKFSDFEFLLQRRTFPAVVLNLEDGDIVLDYIKNTGEPKAQIEFEATRIGTKPAPRVASYSSRGPSPAFPFVLKPDLMAPGTLILASWPENAPLTNDMVSIELFNSFNLLSGTSISCSHAAGVAALLKSAHPEWGPSAIRSAMMTTCDATDNTFNPIQDIGAFNQPANPLAMGAGHINPNRALDPGLIYDIKVEEYITFLCALNYTNNQIQAITRSSSYNCSNPILDLNYPSFIAFFKANNSFSEVKTVEFQRTLTNVGDGGSTYVAKLTPMDGLEVNVVPEKLAFKEKNENQSFKLTLKGSVSENERGVYGSISWVDIDGNHVVRSPIVAISRLT